MTASGRKAIEVFIENEAGSDVKHHYDEEAFVVVRTERVGAEYPYPYGFVPGTLAPDGDAADCFVITDRALRTGDRLACEVVALIEQTEGGEIDHNVIAVPTGDPAPDLDRVWSAVDRFAARFMAGVPGRNAVMGRTLPPEAAAAYLEECAARHDDRIAPG